VKNVNQKQTSAIENTDNLDLVCCIINPRVLFPVVWKQNKVTELSVQQNLRTQSDFFYQ
jgi:hypothetical protein